MESEVTYGRRLRKAAYEDFRNFWSGHRLWVTFATLVSPFLAQAKTYGWASLLTLHETLESATYALGLSLAGNCLIALWGGAKSLDAGLHAKIQQRNPAEEHHFRIAREIIEKLTEKDK